MVSFAVQKLLSLTGYHLFLFPLLYEMDLKKCWCDLCLKSVLPIFSSRSFMESGLTVSSLIHFEFIFVYGIRECSKSLLHMWLPSFPSPPYRSDCLFGGASLLAQMVKKICLKCGRSRFDPGVRKNPLEKGTATHSSILA